MKITIKTTEGDVLVSAYYVGNHWVAHKTYDTRETCSRFAGYTLTHKASGFAFDVGIDKASEAKRLAISCDKYFPTDDTEDLFGKGEIVEKAYREANLCGRIGG